MLQCSDIYHMKYFSFLMWFTEEWLRPFLVSWEDLRSATGKRGLDSRVFCHRGLNGLCLLWNVPVLVPRTSGSYGQHFPDSGNWGPPITLAYPVSGKVCIYTGKLEFPFYQGRLWENSIDAFLTSSYLAGEGKQVVKYWSLKFFKEVLRIRAWTILTINGSHSRNNFYVILY